MSDPHAFHDPRAARLGRVLGVACVLVLGLAAVAPEAAGGQAEGLVQAVWNHRSDVLGFRWDIMQNGTVNDGQSDCFDGGLLLRCNNIQFNPQSQMMTADGSEYVLTGQCGNIQVTRRVRPDYQRGGVRYIEIVHNPSRQKQNANLQIYSRLGGSCGMVVDSRGKPFNGSFEKKTCGYVAVQNQSSRPTVFFLTHGERQRDRPRVMVQQNRNFTTHYNLELKPGETQAVLHWVAQRRGILPQAVPKTIEAFYKRRRLVDPEVPKDLRREIVNFRVTAGWGVEMAGRAYGRTRAVLEALLPERPREDVLVFDGETRVRGAAAGGPLEVLTSFGRAEVPLPEAVLLWGGAGQERPMRLHLRGGEILVGRIGSQELNLRGGAGLRLALRPAELHALVMHPTPEEGKAPEAAAGFVGTHRGDFLAVRNPASSPLTLVTAWGKLAVTLAEVQGLTYQREPQPGYRLHLQNGSSLLGFLDQEALEVESLRFGKLTIPAEQVASYVVVPPARSQTGASPEDGAEPDADDGDDGDEADEADEGDGEDEDAADDEDAEEEEEEVPERRGPAFRLQGEQTLVGLPACETLGIETRFGTTSPPTSAIRKLEREEEGRRPLFRIVLAPGTLENPGGASPAEGEDSPDEDEAAESEGDAEAEDSAMVGQLTQTEIPVRVGEATWRIPVRHIVRFNARALLPRQGGGGYVVGGTDPMDDW